jgi:hypothetical protein
MKNQFIPYEQSFELAELGFDKPCFGIFYFNSINGEPLFLIEERGSKYSVAKGYAGGILSPLYQQAFEWFIENYGKNGILFSDGCQWTFDLRWEDDDDYGYPSIQFPKREVGREMFDTYEEARFGCLRKLIEIVKNK